MWGGRGGAKSESIAKELLNYANNYTVRILCGREIQNSITDSVYSLLADLISQLEYKHYRIIDNNIFNNKTGSNFIFKGLWLQEKKQTIKSLANIDIAWIEEAQSMSAKSLQILDPTIRKKDSEIWFSFNRMIPDDPIWLFKESIPLNNKIEININYMDNPYLPNVLREQVIRSKSDYLKGISEDYLHTWIGDPNIISDKTILTVREVQDAIDRKVEAIGAIEIGVDVARFGNDRTVFFKRKGTKIIDYAIYRKKKTTEIAGLVIDFIGRLNTHIPIKIDDTGVGGGVTDILSDNGYNVIPVIFGSRADDPDRYTNKITEMWFNFKENINKYDLLDLQELRSELTTREYKIDLKGRKQIESKEEYKKRFNKSPDLADALLLCFLKDNNAYYIC